MIVEFDLYLDIPVQPFLRTSAATSDSAPFTTLPLRSKIYENKYWHRLLFSSRRMLAYPTQEREQACTNMKFVPQPRADIFYFALQRSLCGAEL